MLQCLLIYALYCQDQPSWKASHKLLFCCPLSLSKLAGNVLQLGEVAVFENRQPATAAKFIKKSSLSILLLGIIRRLEQKLNSEQKLSIYSSPRHIAKPPVVRRFCLSAFDSLRIFIEPFNNVLCHLKPLFIFTNKP